jgi:hypothetical protein
MLAPVHFSTLKFMAQSPAHYLYAATHEPPQSAAFRLGSAVDAFCTGEGERVILCPHKKNTKAYAQWAADEQLITDNSIILTPAEYEKATEMTDSIVRHKQAMELLAGERQRFVEWKWLGRHCAGTPDVFTLDHLTELKTGRTAHPDRFMSAARFYGYHAQLAWYRRGLIECGFGTPAAYWIVAVESAPPFPVTVFRMTDNAIDLGERACRAWLERLLVCESADVWPAYTDAVVPFDVQEEGFTLTIDGEETEVA